MALAFSSASRDFVFALDAVDLRHGQAGGLIFASSAELLEEAQRLVKLAGAHQVFRHAVGELAVLGLHFERAPQGFGRAL